MDLKIKLLDPTESIFVFMLNSSDEEDLDEEVCAIILLFTLKFILNLFRLLLRVLILFSQESHKHSEKFQQRQYSTCISSVVFAMEKVAFK